MTISKKMKSEIEIIIKDYKNEKNKKNTLKKIESLLLKDKPKPRTQTVRFSLVKKMFKNRSITDKEFLKHIRPKQSITDAIVAENILVRDSQKLMTIKKEMIEKILSLGDSKNVHDLAIYLLFVSGRRTSEMLHAVFHNDKKNKLIRITGVLKRTDKTDCVFPPLINKTKFFKIYKKFKKTLKYSNQYTFQRTIHRKTTKLLGVKPHALRGMYITYAFIFRNKSNLKINTFIKEKLCHQSINASLNYTQYKLDDDINSDFVK